MAEGKKPVTGAVGEFIGIYLAIVVVVYGLVPLGVIGFITARLVYGSWELAATFYGAQVGMAAGSIIGLIPLYGNKLHYIFAQENILPWAAAHGIGPSWLLSTSGLLCGALAAMCPGALAFRIFEKTTGRVPGTVLTFGALVFILGTIYSGFLFFGSGN